MSRVQRSVAWVAVVVALVLLAGGPRPAPGQSKPAPRKLDLAHIIAPPESGALGFKYLAEEVTRRSNGTLNVVFHGGTLLSKELEIMDAVKSGNIALGAPAGAACTVFPEMCVFLTPYLVRDYNHAYAMFNGEIGKSLDETFQKKYKVKVVFFYDYGFRHFWNNRHPITTPADLKGLKMRVQQGRVFADTVNGLGASAVPMPWGEVVPAAQQGVIDGADLPIYNINALKVYEVSVSQLRAHAAGHEPRRLEESHPRAAEALRGGRPGGAEEDPRADRERGQPRQGQGDPGSEGHEGERRRRGFLPQGGGGQDLAGLQATVRRALGPGRQREVVRAALALAAVGLALAGPAAAAECPPPRAVTATVLGMKYCADPAFGAVIAERVQKIRADVRAQRQAGRLVVYASTPISPRGGGDTTVNLGVAASVKARLEKEYGGAVWVLDPGAYQLPDTNGRAAGGGDYMVMWTEILGGEDGGGRDFDMVHFTGPGDMRAFFGCGREDVSGCVARHPAAVAIADPARRQAFVRYYTLRASSAYSTGAHDEWNIVVKVNRKRPIGDQVAVFFDGRAVSPAEMDAEIAPGYEVR